MKSRIPFALGAALLLLAGPAWADDAKIQRKIEERLAKARLGSSADVKVTVNGGIARLEGAVIGYETSYRAVQAARKETKEVINELTVGIEPRPDAELRGDVEDAILGYSQYGVFDSIEAGVEDGRVSLRGSVRQPWRKEDIEARVAKVPGVKAMDTEIRVQPIGGFDDRLRRELVSRIYGSDSFSQYAGWPNPPIRIVVENGHVTLTGYVRSAVEQAMLGQIARGTLAFGVDNRVQVEGARPKEDQRPGASS